MSLLIANYKTLVFDCDGVILNSNQVKTDAFYQVALPYGESVAKALVDYHITNGGISRYQKFAYLLEVILPKYAPHLSIPSLEKLLEQYAQRALQGLLTSEVASGLIELKEATPNARWLIVSGGDQSELRHIFAQRCLSELFDAGIYGSPDSKHQILAREISNGTIQRPALFLGDSKYDYQASSEAGLNFMFLSDWSEVVNWQDWCKENNISFKKSISAM